MPNQGSPAVELIIGLLQGGIRVNAFVSGGLIKSKAPAMVGTKLDGFTHAADWCAACTCAHIVVLLIVAGGGAWQVRDVLLARSVSKSFFASGKNQIS